MATRIDATPAAVELLDRLIERHGPLLFHQSGGCCDGSAPMCYPQPEFRIGQTDAYLGAIGPGATPFYIGGAQYEYWKHTRLTVDVVAGRGSGFSVEAPEGVRFVIRSRLFTDDEALALDASGPAPTGPRHARDGMQGAPPAIEGQNPVGYRFDPGLRLSPQGRPDQG